ncbi:MAG: GNAT family N-acetyltransferase [Myxococcota bacterium]
MSGRVTVSAAGPEDWMRSRALRLRALREDPDAFARTHAAEAAQPDAFWKARLVSATATLLATLDGTDVGISVLAPWRDSPGDVGLFGVWVAADARGKGVGDALMRQAIAEAQAAGVQRIRLEVGDFNQRAINLYARAGFVRSGRQSALPPPRQHITEQEWVYPLTQK